MMLPRLRLWLPWRVAAGVLAVVPLAVCAVVLLRCASGLASLGSAEEIRSELLAYANEHRSWDGVEPLLRELGERADVPIALVAPDGEVIAASGELGSARALAGRIDAARADVGALRPPEPNVVAGSGGISLTYYQWQFTDAERERRQALAEQAADCLREHAPPAGERDRVTRRSTLPVAAGGAAEPAGGRLPGAEVCVPDELEQPTAAARGLAAKTVEGTAACLDVRGLAYEVVTGAHGVPAVRPGAGTAENAGWAACTEAAVAAAKSDYVAGPADLYLGSSGGWGRTGAVVAAALLAALGVAAVAVRRSGRPVLLGEVAHELRGPLANVRSQLEAAQDGVLAVDRALIRTLLGESTLLERLVADLQDLALADAARLRIHPEEVDAVELAGAAVEAFRARAVAGGVELVVVADGPVLVHVDPERVRQALSNLVANALRATPRGGRVVVSVGRTSNAIRLAVADTGCGIEARDVGRVFERFYRASGRAGGGVGLGLAIAKRVVEAHGGRIEVNSSPRRGSTFTILLPGARGEGWRGT